MSISDMRKEYAKHGLLESDADACPFKQFDTWFKEAVATVRGDWFEANAFNLSTATPDGKPFGRVILLKDYGEDGFTFFTNYISPKADQLAANPQAAMTFWWPPVERQVRIEGTVERTSRQANQDYHASRPRGSQLGAVVSDQSAPLPSRAELEAKLVELEAKYDGQEIPCPEDWGGYRLTPTSFEFWQGRPNRLHDRLCYTPGENGQWEIVRLSP